MNEHGPHAPVRGPDGLIYMVVGNHAALEVEPDASSPYHHFYEGDLVQTRYEDGGGHAHGVKAPGGFILRTDPAGKKVELFAGGLRNSYDLAFNSDGELFTYESDMEWDEGLPWYRPTRVLHVIPGAEFGWRSGWAKWPTYFLDSLPSLVETGRGSPTGVVAYRHRQFPRHYRGGVFTACWTFGRVFYFPLKSAGATCESAPETFLETTGDVGFAPCDLAVGPAGDLFVAIGGRRTRGSVFRVRYTRAGKIATPRDPLQQVLAADQPQSSWSRALWVPAARKLGSHAFQNAVGDERLDARRRVRAVEVLVELFGGLDPHRAKRWAKTTDPALRARIAWGLGRGPYAPETAGALARLTSDDHPAVARAAW
ncbi:MAG: heme-binding protein, partial [Nitrospinae bacterium]|nr:heme-binding protein [Nitrospinota bacterium]